MSGDQQSETLAAVCEQAYKEKNASPYTWTQLWENIIWEQFIPLTFLNVGFFGSIIMYVFGLNSVPVKPLTIAWIFIAGSAVLLGSTAGSHRLWSHRSYKANLPLRILLMILYSAMGMYTLFDWVRDHRVHHKYAETNGDPHNAGRGFIFSHLGWLSLKRHPDCIRRAKEVDMTDIKADAVVMFQKRYKNTLNILFCFTLPTLVPIIFWEETVMHAILTQCFIRYMGAIHCIWSVNSFAHLWGNRRYNRLINPADNYFVSYLNGGEGWHNYHHTFPWDYKSSELPYDNFNTTTLFIETFAKLGWATDLRQPSPELINKVIKRIGDKSEIPIQHTSFLSSFPWKKLHSSVIKSNDST